MKHEAHLPLPTLFWLAVRLADGSPNEVLDALDLFQDGRPQEYVPEADEQVMDVFFRHPSYLETRTGTVAGLNELVSFVNHALIKCGFRLPAMRFNGTLYLQEGAEPFIVIVSTANRSLVFGEEGLSIGDLDHVGAAHLPDGSAFLWRWDTIPRGAQRGTKNGLLLCGYMSKELADKMPTEQRLPVLDRISAT